MINDIKKGINGFREKITLISIEVAVVLFAFFASIASFVLIARMIFVKKREVLDQQIFLFFEPRVSNINTTFMQFFSFLGSHYFLIPANILLSAWFLFVKRQTWFSIKIPVISLSSLLLMFALKQFFHRERPLVPLLQEAKGLSFPSGHALMSFAFYGLLAYMSWEGYENKLLRIVLSIVFLFTILCIGLSRIYLRVHFASDVIAGFCLGLIWLIFSLLILNKIEALTTKNAMAD